LVEKALVDAGLNAQVQEWEVEFEEGVAQLEVEIMKGANKIEYKYDIETGNMIDKLIK